MNARATRFPLFDSLRALAALSVFGTHAFSELYNGGTLRQYGARLEVGVFIFFVISGFLLYRPFVRARLREEQAPGVASYGWRRLLRIGPAYWVALTIVAVWLRFGYLRDAGNAATLYFFGQSYRSGGLAIAGLSQAWSLCVEAAFYVFLPLWALGMRSLPTRTGGGRLRTELAGLAALVVAGFGFIWLAAANGAVNHFDQFPLHLTLACYIEVFAVGMCLAVLSVWYEDRELPAWLKPIDRLPGLAWAMALLAFWVVSTRIGLHGGPGEPSGAGQYVARTALYTVVALGVVVPAVFGNQAHGLVRRLLANRALLWIGLISYSLFLYNVAVVIQVHRWGIPAGGLVALLMSLAIAALSYYVVERPALRLKRLVKASPEPSPREAIAEPAPVAPARVSRTG